MVDRQETAPVRAGEELDWAALEAYLRANVTGLQGEMTVLQFPNGSANLTYQVSFGDRRLVVRRPPFGVLAPGAHDMRREYRALSRLYAGYPRAPRAFSFCEDPSVVGSDFLVVEYRPGIVVWDAIPDSMSDLPDAGRRIGFAVVDALADLHAVDPVAVGLGDLGRPDGFLTRQLAGWRKRWDAVAPEDGDGQAEQLSDRLAARMPVSGPPALVHNDFKIDNCQFAPNDPDQVVSVFDWDMTTLGDPLVDLGTLLNYWPDPSDGPDVVLIVPGVDRLGLPTRAEVVERYRERSGRQIADIDWYEAYGRWKTIVILQQLYARYLRGETTDERMGTRGAQVVALTRSALDVLDRSEVAGSTGR
ncbi:MAG: aminoglycoside phosphotransferase [Frankiales bacterium]|nr:aminoglycoside phosphotransferase [Frankiales bacterium]